MLEPVLDFVDRLVTQFSWARLFLVSSLILLLFGVVGLYEYHTGHFELNKLERTVSLVEKIAQVKSSVGDDRQLASILSRVTEEANDLVKPKGELLELSEYHMKALFSFIPWLIFGVLAVITSKKGRLKGFAGVMLFSMPLSMSLAFIPTFKSINVNYYFIPWVTFFIAVCLILVYQKRRQKN